MYLWAKDDPFGAELAELSLGAGALAATGVALGTSPQPYRLDYELTTVEGYVTERLVVRTRGQGWRRAVILQRATSGAWSCTTEAEGSLALAPPGGELAALAGSLDCDLGLSPLTNSMPVLRHSLHQSGSDSRDFLMAWVSVPDLAIYVSRQRYTFVRVEADASVVRFESLDSAFVADITFDADGVVLDYPGLARRMA